MKIIVSETELVKEIRKMLIEVSSQISTSFSAGSMFNKNLKDDSAQKFFSRADEYAKSSTLSPEKGAPYVAMFKDTPGNEFIFLRLKGKFFFGKGASQEMTVFFPVDKKDSPKGYNHAKKEPDAIKNPLYFLLIFLAKDGSYKSFYPENPDSEYTITNHLKGANKLLENKNNVNFLVYSIVQKALENIDKLTISKNLKKDDKALSNSNEYKKMCKEHFKDSAQAIVDAIAAQQKKEKTGIDLDKKEPFFIEKGSVKVRYKNYDDNGKPGVFKFGSYRDINKEPLGDWKAFMEYIKGDSGELKKEIGPKIKAAIIQDESDLKTYWEKLNKPK